MPTESPAETETLLLTDAQVGELLNVPPVTVRNLHRFHELRGVVVARKLRWRRADVEKFVAELGV